MISAALQPLLSCYLSGRKRGTTEGGDRKTRDEREESKGVKRTGEDRRGRREERRGKRNREERQEKERSAEERKKAESGVFQPLSGVKGSPRQPDRFSFFIILETHHSLLL